VGEIEDPQNPEGEGKAGGDQKEKGASGDSAHKLVKENVKRHRF
jgi:hypothetical protein